MTIEMEVCKFESSRKQMTYQSEPRKGQEDLIVFCSLVKDALGFSCGHSYKICQICASDKNNPRSEKSAMLANVIRGQLKLRVVYRWKQDSEKPNTHRDSVEQTLLNIKSRYGDAEVMSVLVDASKKGGMPDDMVTELTNKILPDVAIQ